ncbi:Putative 2EXR domain-containing protein [Colletotrichum destructivum]|uniref:2EXR domain-containing protein n=1 Tax=Colletotrichum destructivum TaxID=34406 RepID=A0AAX4IQ92_9PEZI|nr:Putative 2EXR domain-containing protein [Colletotrichum destructivum]
MAAKTFHNFPLLPGELRDEIWDKAVRRQGYRGVHYFSVFDATSYCTRPVPEEFTNEYLLAKVSEKQLHVFGAPMSSGNPSSPSWTIGNQSTYAIDAGLWTACRESRAAMYRRYTPEKWANWYTEPFTSFLEHMALRPGNRELPAAFKIVEGDNSQCFTILPFYDLFLVQFSSFGPYFKSLGKEMPFSSRKFGLEGIPHIAVEFDPSWTLEELDQYEKDNGWEWEYAHIYHPKGSKEEGEPTQPLSDERYAEYDSLILASRSLGLPRGVHLWLVDRRLRRKPSPMDNEKKKPSFGRCGTYGTEQLVFESQNCKYYAVPEERIQEFCFYEEPETISTTIWDFLSELSRLAGKHEAENYGIEEEDANPRTLGVLVCEME